MNLEQLKSVMKFQLSHFNNEGVPINDLTIHNTVLRTDDGFAHVNSVYLYQNAIKWTLSNAHVSLKNWPTNWLSLNVHDLAIKIL
jgi:hypothetical protein